MVFSKNLKNGANYIDKKKLSEFPSTIKPYIVNIERCIFYEILIILSISVNDGVCEFVHECMCYQILRTL